MRPPWDMRRGKAPMATRQGGPKLPGCTAPPRQASAGPLSPARSGFRPARQPLLPMSAPCCHHLRSGVRRMAARLCVWPNARKSSRTDVIRDTTSNLAIWCSWLVRTPSAAQNLCRPAFKQGPIIWTVQRPECISAKRFAPHHVDGGACVCSGYWRSPRSSLREQSSARHRRPATPKRDVRLQGASPPDRTSPSPAHQPSAAVLRPEAFSPKDIRNVPFTAV